MPQPAHGRVSRTPRPRFTQRAGVQQLGVFALAYLVYFGVRAITEGSAAQAVHNAINLIRIERWIGIAWEGDVQQIAMQSRVLVEAANAVYVYGHWPVIIVAGVLLFRYRRQDYFRLRDVCLMSGIVGLGIFVLFPVAPPRLTDLPLVDTITRDDAGYRQIVPPSLVNEYAAMPSFHAGWNLLLGVVVFGATQHWLLRTLAVAGPAAMMLAVVVTANHFVMDVVVGVAIVVACLLVRDGLHRRSLTARMKASDERSRDAGGPRRPIHVPHRPPRAAALGARDRRPPG